jgi:hypothetical protein
MPGNDSLFNYIVRFFAIVPLILYMIVALLLTIIAIFSVYDSVQIMLQMIVSMDFANGLTNVITALLLTITIIVLFETVTVYFRTSMSKSGRFLLPGSRAWSVMCSSSTSAAAIPFRCLQRLHSVLIVGIIFVKPEEVR